MYSKNLSIFWFSGSASLAIAALEPWAFEPLPLGSVKPAGWLHDQLRLEGDGLAGHLHDFYDYVAHEPWLGGDKSYSILYEGFPYWYNGLVPLAYHLDDDRLKEQVHSATKYVLDHQQDDGWLGVEKGTQRNFWARHMLCLGMIQLAEANSTWEQPIVDSLHKFAKIMNTMLADNYTGYLYHDGDEFDEGNVQWGRVRSADLIISLQWLYEKHPGDQGSLLLENMKYLHDAGLNWETFYNNAAYFGQGFDHPLGTLPDDVTDDNFPFEHGVNVGQGLKAAGVIYRFTHNESLVQTAMDGVNWTMSYHGAASGTILADERLQGLMPYSGSELCTAVETMYSLAYLYQSLGDADYAERAELAAFNALPAMLTPDWWGRQYVEQPNQPVAEKLNDASIFWNTNDISPTFGMEVNYPCCTVNHGQGYPKFTSNLFVKTGDNGLAHAMLSPSSVNAELKDGNVQINCNTGYPFLDTLDYTTTSDCGFDFHVRVPSWAGASSSIQLDDGEASPLSPNSKTGLHKISIPQGSHSVKYTLDSAIQTTPRANDTIAVYKGALLYAIEIQYTNTSSLPKAYTSPDGPTFPDTYAPPQAMDWELHNTSAWNIAIDPSTLKYNAPAIDLAVSDLANPIFAPGAPPASMTVKGCLIDWPLFKNSTPGIAPPVRERKCLRDEMDVKLIPYAAAKLHMAEIPTIDLSD